MNRSLISAAFFFTFSTHFLLFAANNSTEYVTKHELKKALADQASDLSPGPSDIIFTGFMVIGSAMVIPYTCIPDSNNPQMTRNKKAACAGTMIYLIGQTGDFFVKVGNLIRHNI